MPTAAEKDASDGEGDGSSEALGEHDLRRIGTTNGLDHGAPGTPRLFGDHPEVVLLGPQRLRVGVTGHRLDRLHEAGADLKAVEGACADVLERIGEIVGGLARVHLVSSLADGADSMVADCATARGWRLDAVLPLPRDDYAADFARGELREAHDRRIAAACAVFELPAESGESGDRAKAYERAGRLVLAQSDVLLAVWDGSPAKGRGGTGQIVAEAVLRGVPVIHVDPASPQPPKLLWDGLEEHDFGQQSIETVSRGGLDHLPRLITGLVDRPEGADLSHLSGPVRMASPRFAVAYPLLLALVGVRPFRLASSATPGASSEATAPSDEAVHDWLTRWFDDADAQASASGRTFRSAYVTNFSLAAAAVLISLSGLALPVALKPVLALLELSTIGGVLALTHVGRRAHWHQRWLDQRHLAERLRCLIVARRLGELGLRRGRAADGGGVSWVIHAAARMTGLPSARVDEAYLEAVRRSLVQLLDAQLAYLRLDAARMHRLEHRLHRLGTAFFMTTAVLCLGMFVFEVTQHLTGDPVMERMAPALATATTMGSAALPALGAAIYGIRMQGDFAGVSERDHGLAEKLQALRTLVIEDALEFDLLSRRVRRTTELLTDDLSTWLHAYKARPLTLPG